MPLGELAREGRLAVAERGLGRSQECSEPPRRLEEDERPRLAREGREASRTRAAPARDGPREPLRS